jgi:hypothetical protein
MWDVMIADCACLAAFESNVLNPFTQADRDCGLQATSDL